MKPSVINTSLQSKEEQLGNSLILAEPSCLADSVAWTQRMLLDSGTNQRFQRGFKAFPLVYQSQPIAQEPLNQTMNYLHHQSAMKNTPQMMNGVNGTPPPMQMAMDAQSIDRHQGSVQSKHINHQGKSIAIVDESSRDGQIPHTSTIGHFMNNGVASHGALNNLSTSTPPPDEINQFAPKFTATTTLKSRIGDIASSKQINQDLEIDGQNNKRMAQQQQQQQLQTSRVKTSPGKLIKGQESFSEQLQTERVTSAPWPNGLSNTNSMGEFLAQNLQLISPTNNGDKRNICEPAKPQFYQSHSKARLHEQQSRMKQTEGVIISGTVSVQQLAKSVVRGSAERQKSAYSSSLGRFRSATKLNNCVETGGGEVAIDFKRFNEDLEEIVQYRERDIGKKPQLQRLQSAKNVKKQAPQGNEKVPQAFQEISKIIEQAAPQGPTPVQQSLLLLSKCSLKMNLSLEQQKLAECQNLGNSGQPSPRKVKPICKSRLKLSMSPSVLKKAEANRGSKVGLISSARALADSKLKGNNSVIRLMQVQGSQSSLLRESKILSGGIMSPNGSTIQGSKYGFARVNSPYQSGMNSSRYGSYNVSAPQDSLMNVFNSQRRLAQLKEVEKQYQKYGILGNTNSLLTSQKHQQKLNKAPMTANSTASNNNPRFHGRPLATARLTSVSNKGEVTSPANSNNVQSPRSFPLTSQNSTLYLGKQPPKHLRGINQQSIQSHKIASPGRLQDIHILRPSHIALKTQVQIARPKYHFPKAIPRPFHFNQQQDFTITPQASSQSFSLAQVNTSVNPTQASIEGKTNNPLRNNSKEQSISSAKNPLALMKATRQDRRLSKNSFVGAIKIQRRYQHISQTIELPICD